VPAPLTLIRNDDKQLAGKLANALFNDEPVELEQALSGLGNRLRPRGRIEVVRHPFCHRERTISQFDRMPHLRKGRGLLSRLVPPVDGLALAEAVFHKHDRLTRFKHGNGFRFRDGVLFHVLQLGKGALAQSSVPKIL